MCNAAPHSNCNMVWGLFTAFMTVLNSGSHPNLVFDPTRPVYICIACVVYLLQFILHLLN